MGSLRGNGFVHNDYPGGVVLYTMILQGRERVFAPFESYPGGLSGGGCGWLWMKLIAALLHVDFSLVDI